MHVDLQITSGRGPLECGYVVARLLPILLKEAKTMEVDCTILNQTPVPGASPAAFLSVIVRLSGPKANELAQKWIGTIQWVGQSPYRPTHKRKNWFVGVSLVDTRIDTAAKPENVHFQSMRSSGPGGQNVNKTNSAVRARDLASGETATASSHRSQSQNRREAAKKLAQLLIDQMKNLNNQREKSRWDKHQELVRGNPTRIFHEKDVDTK